ncbi:MAG: DUF3737 family protein [Clostridia bacterium]|nr:DUF3737 family protein [Clostridia bacterium]
MKTHERRVIENKTYDEERALYHLENAIVRRCVFAGEADGESVLKECRGVTVEHSSFSLRYPLWHAENYFLDHCDMDENTRAALWYCKNGTIAKSLLGGIKAVRECDGVELVNCNIVSPEFGWRSKNVTMTECQAESEYFMFESKNLKLNKVTFNGIYSFQYVKNATIENCIFATKDAFWHSKNITVKNSVLKGEYLGWYSDGLTLINCVISGTQPLCYCKNLKLINCKTEGCDLAFEYSDVHANILGDIISVKNPKSGKIFADKVGETIFGDSVIRCKGKVIIR